MKHPKLSVILLVIICLFVNSLTSSPLQKDNGSLLAKTVKVDGKTELQLSFLGKEPVMIGNLEIMNDSNEKIEVINEIDVKSSPEYYTIDISKYQFGKYIIALNIEGKLFTTSFIVK